MNSFAHRDNKFNKLFSRTCLALQQSFNSFVEQHCSFFAGDIFTFEWVRWLHFFLGAGLRFEYGRLVSLKPAGNVKNSKATWNRPRVSLILETVPRSPASYLHSSPGCGEHSDINYSWCFLKHPSDDSRDPGEKGLSYFRICFLYTGKKNKNPTCFYLKGTPSAERLKTT